MKQSTIDDTLLILENNQPKGIEGLHELVIPFGKNETLRRDNHHGYHVHVLDKDNNQYQGVLTLSGSIDQPVLYEIPHSGRKPMNFSDKKKKTIYNKIMEKPIPLEHWRLPGKDPTIFYDPNH
jgi:hypothetical protein